MATGGGRGASRSRGTARVAFAEGLRDAGRTAWSKVTSVLVDDLPDAVAALEATNEVDSLRQACAGQQRAERDVDHDGAPPDARTACELCLRPSAAIRRGEIGLDHPRADRRARSEERSR